MLMILYYWHNRLQHCKMLLILIMPIKKPSCLRIGPRHNKMCSKISSRWLTAHMVWRNSVFSVLFHVLWSSSVLDQAERQFYLSVSSILARVGRLASEEVVIQLLKHKCLPILLYAGLYNISILKFTVNRFCMKLFETSNLEIHSSLLSDFVWSSYCLLPNVLVSNRPERFIRRLSRDI